MFLLIFREGEREEVGKEKEREKESERKIDVIETSTSARD